MAEDALIRPTFGVGDVLGKSLTIWFQNLVPLGILGIAFSLPILPFSYTLLQTLLPMQRQLSSGQLASGQMQPDHFSSSFFWATVANAFVVIVCYQLLTAAVAYGVINRLRDQPIEIAACFGQAFKRIVPVLMTGLLGAILTWLACFLLVIPGIIVALNFWVAIPVCVAEELGARASLSRAKYLARGYRWKIFGALLVAIIIAAVIQQVLGFVARLGTPADATLTTQVSLTAAIGIINQAIFATLFAVLATCAYYHLRVAKEGVDIDQIAAVFD